MPQSLSKRKRPPSKEATTTPFQPVAASPQIPAEAAAKEQKRVMATFYLPPALVDKLDRAWLNRRLKDRKAQKSHLVAEALEAYLKAHE